MEHDTNRRSFLGFLIFGLGAIFSAVIGVPVTLFVIDPRNRPAPKSELNLVEGIDLDDPKLASEPMQGVIRDTRRDGWTLYPSDVVGRVWVKQVGARPNGLDTMTNEALEEFNGNAEAARAARAAYLLVFTTICPHLGCSVNQSGAGFQCPCHAATFSAIGARVGAGNPAPRDMDTLHWEIDPTDPERDRILVKYENYKAGQAAKELA